MRLFRVIVIGVFFIVSSVFGAVTSTWVGGSGDNLWNVVDNWDPASMPDSADTVDIYGPPYEGPTIDSTCNAVCDQLIGPGNSVDTANLMQITGGTLNILNNWRFPASGSTTGPGEVQISGGTVTVARYIYLGYSGTGIITMTDGFMDAGWIAVGQNTNSHGTLNMEDGTVNVQSGMRIGSSGLGKLNMTGGTINVSPFIQTVSASSAVNSEVVMDGGTINVSGYLSVGTAAYGSWIMNGGTLTLSQYLNIGATDGTGYFEFNGGTITLGRSGDTDLVINDNSQMNMTGNGLMVIRGDAVDYVNDLVMANKLIAYYGKGVINVEYDSVENVTNITCSGSSSIYVYLLGGQSNMDGRADIDNLPSELQQVRDDIPVYFDGDWCSLRPGLSYLQPDESFGPEVTYGRDVAEFHGGSNVVLVKYARGATSLAVDWRPTTGNDYITFVEAVNAALTNLSVRGYTPVITGMIWMQGEEDTVVFDTANAYEQNLIEFIQAIRNEFDVADMPFVIGQLSNSSSLPYGEIVREAQLAVSQSMSDTQLVITNDLPLKTDNVHYDADGQVELGGRFSEKMIFLEKDCEDFSVADLNNDCAVDAEDLLAFAEMWLVSNSSEE